MKDIKEYLNEVRHDCLKKRKGGYGKQLYTIERDMHNFFRNIIEKKDRICFETIGENRKAVSYGEYFDDVCACLEKIEKTCQKIAGVHIGLLADNNYEYIVVLGALFLGKAFIVPINSYEASENVDYILNHADVEILITSDSDKERKAKKTLRVADITERSDDKHYEYDERMDECIDETKMLIYTSGTTGRPKGVIQPLSRFFNLLEKGFSENSQFSTSFTHMYITVPLYHVMGFYYWLMSFRCGTVLYTNNYVGDMLYELKQIKPDIIIATPAFIKVLEVALRKKTNSGTENLRYIISGGASLNEELINKLTERKIGCLNVYGMTETAGSGTFNFVNINNLKSIGVPTPNTVVKIVDGEICISSESIMEGYYKDPQATAESLVDGFMHTGDLGYIDEKGYVYITGRKKNLIILSGGENVSPEEIESKLYDSGFIKECIVFEKSDRIAAKIYCPQVSEETVKKYVEELNEKLPIYKRIYYTEIVDHEFEKTANGKIKR